MRKLLPLSLIILSVTFLLNGCKKNSVEEQYTETVNPVIPDLTTPVSASVIGFITDENGNALIDASVKAGTVTVITDKYGYFKISNTAFAKSAGFIEVTKPGFFTGYRTFIPREGKEVFINLRLITKTIAGTVDAATGGTVNTLDGAAVSLPSNAVVIASNNTAYSGTVTVSAHWLNPADMQTTQQTMPGDLRGIDQSGYLNALVTYGMLAVELTGDAGEKLQIANGKKASLSFPIPSSLQGTAPNTIPLWYFDETNGLWKEDGLALKNGSNYQGDVSHFTFWNCDAPCPLVNFTVQLLNSELKPLSNVGVTIEISGLPNSARGNYTDTNGIVTGMIPANSNLVINVISVCNTTVYSKNITTTHSDVNLGSINIDMQQNSASIKGTVKKCNGLAVTNGYVIVMSGSNNKVVEIQNGTFNSTVVICSNVVSHVVAVDRETSQQSSVTDVTLTAGSNDLGSISACAVPTSESITYVLDGVSKTLSLPQYMFGATHDFTGDGTTFINALDLLNGSTEAFFFVFSGQAVTGTLFITGVLRINGQQYSYVAGPPDIIITNYGLIGEYISGSFNVEVLNSTDGSAHIVTCTFNVKRDS